jgi:fructoselysine 6-kinase
MNVILQPRIAFIGDLTVDRYVEKNEIRLGGAALNCAIWAKRLKAVPSIVTAIGSDDPGKKFLKKLISEDIDATHVCTIPGVTSSIEIFVNEKGERRYGVWNPGTLKNYHINEIDKKFLETTDAVCVTVYPEYKHILDELNNIQKPKIVVNFSDLHEFGGDISVVQDHLTSTDMLFFGFDKDRDETLINKLRHLASVNNKILIITLGANGAGDAFLTGFLVSYLKTLDIQSSLRNGADLASISMGLPGAY